MRNKIDALLAARGVQTYYRFAKQTGLPETTARRLFQDRDVLPDRKSFIAICKTYNVQPGDILEYVPGDRP